MDIKSILDLRGMKKSCFHKGFDLSGEVISDDWEGDPSIPGGVRKIPPYVDDLKVEAGGIDHAAAGNLSEKFLAECEEILTEGAYTTAK